MTGSTNEQGSAPASPDVQTRASLKAAKALIAEGRHTQAFALMRASLRPESELVLQSRAAAILASIPRGVLGLRPLRLAVLAGSTVDHLMEVLRFWLAVSGVEAEVYVAPYDTVEQTLLDTASPLYAFKPQLVWLFSTQRDVELRIEAGATIAEVQAKVEQEIARRARLWQIIESRLACPVLQNNADIPADDPFGHMAGAMIWGRRSALRLYNALLSAAVPPGVILFDLDHVAAMWGRARWVDPRHWFHSKHAFCLDASGQVASQAARVIGALLGQSKKCLVLDLDNTLWGGVIGDDGMGGIVLGNGNGADGEAFVAFQHYVKALQQRGIVLAVCSKNEMDTAREPFQSHPDMVLKLDDIAVFRANWNDKAGNIRAIAETLSLGLDAMVFVDDNPVERDLVHQHLPMVEVIEMPDDPAFYVEALARAGCFEATAFSDEDRQRASVYQSNAQREQAREEFVDMASYLKSLEMKAQIVDADELTLPRFAQLINKSNQFHLTGCRMFEPELLALQQREDHRVLGFRLVDRFGDNGLISAVVLRRETSALHIDTWVMSCRVLGRTMEEFVANEILRVAREWKCNAIIGRYVASAKNALVAGLYERLGFVQDVDGSWRIAASEAIPPWETQIN
ncbi:HAD-IIIC family phosphatase [soil metagenome]